MKKILSIFMLLVAFTTGAWADATWTFKNNTAVWAGATLNGGNQYNENAVAVQSGGVIFTGTSGFVSTANGIGFNAIGSTADENISVVLPAGYKAIVTIYTSSNRTVIAKFGEESQTYNASWASTAKTFDNSEGSSPVTLYLYCNQNPGGDDQKKAPFLQSIELIDASTVTYHTFKVNAVNSANKEIIKTLYADDESYNGKNQSLVFPKYLTDANKMVTYSKANNTYGQSWTATDKDETYEVEYTAYDGVAYFVEVEDVVSGTAYSSWNCSNGGAVRGFTTAKSIFTVPATGTYDITYAACNNNVNYDMAVTLSKNETEIATKSDFKSVSINYIKTTGIVTNNDVSLAKDDVLNLTPSTTNGIVDYMLIELKSISGSLPESGIGTLASAYAIDCANLPSGVKAYKVSNVSANGATLEEVTTAVAPGTGLILRGTAGVYEIPVVAEGTDISSTNELEAAVTATTLKDGTFYIMQGGQFHLVEGAADEAARTVPAGKAYLPVANGNGARSISLSFGEITGVSEVAAEAKAVADGKFIKNGQLVIEKNGKEFNANGAQIK